MQLPPTLSKANTVASSGSPLSGRGRRAILRMQPLLSVEHSKSATSSQGAVIARPPRHSRPSRFSTRSMADRPNAANERCFWLVTFPQQIVNVILALLFAIQQPGVITPSRETLARLTHSATTAHAGCQNSRVSPAGVRRASHRSVQAQLRHTARQVTGWRSDDTRSGPPSPVEAGSAPTSG